MNPDQAEITQQSQQKYTISGAVDFTTAPDLVRNALSFFKKEKASRDQIKQGRVKEGQVKQGQVKVDLSKVTECNSAGLALMFELVKSAQTKNIELRFENLPSTLLTIAKAYGVEAEVKNISE